MKKIVAMLCAAMLCACCVALGACSGSSSSSAAASSSSASSEASSSEASSSAADASAFVGSWKLAALQAEDITMSGDLSSIFDEEASMALVIQDDGTGTLVFAGTEAPFTWTQKSADAITVAVANIGEASSEAASSEAAETSSESAASDSSEAASSEAASSESSAASDASASIASTAADADAIEITMVDGALFMAMDNEDFSGSAIFTADGTYEGAKEISSANSTAITSEADLLGTWTISGMNMLGVSMYGEASDLAQMAGDTDVTIVFEEGGKVIVMGEETTYTVDANGAAIVEGNASVPVTKLENDIVIDMSEAFGMPMVMVFSK